MSRRRSRRRDYNARYEDRHGALIRPSESIYRLSSVEDELDTLVRAAPAIAPIHRLPGLEPGDLMSSPAPISLPEAASWVEYPPFRPTLAQARRSAVARASPSYSYASLLRPYFRVPQRTGVCVARKERREVIFATQGGGRGTPPRRFTVESGYSCGPR